MSDDYFEDRKEQKRQRKIISKTDKSKFKKTDKEKREVFLEERLKKQIKKETLVTGRVLSILPEEILVEHNKNIFTCVLKGSLKQEIKRVKNLVVVGDIVDFDPKSFQIYFIQKRESVLSKKTGSKIEQLIASNIDLVLITTSVKDPPINVSLIDRYIIATLKGNMSPVVIINKSDLIKKEEQPFILEIKKLFQAHCFSVKTKEGLNELKKIMADRTSVFVGESGVGKTSLINLVTQLDLPTKKVTEKLKRGVHTTTRAHLIPLDFGGFCIDTPGIQKFGVWDLKKEDLDRYFTDITTLKEKCHFKDCTHTHEPNCYLQVALKNKEISELRFKSYLDLLKEL